MSNGLMEMLAKNAVNCALWIGAGSGGQRIVECSAWLLVGDRHGLFLRAQIGLEMETPAGMGGRLGISNLLIQV